MNTSSSLSPSSPRISAGFPGGNIRILGRDGATVRLAPDQRDTRGYWFYWRFRAEFPVAGTWRFEFSGPAVGTRGPAVRAAGAKDWHWLSGDALHADDRSFEWTAKGPEVVDFCQCFPYLPEDFDAFAASLAGDPRVSVGEFCRSRKGRRVPSLTLREGSLAGLVLLSCRHHAQEASASWAAEGLLREMLADTPRSVAFRRAFEVVAVPFVDRDGVEDGDQGKNRAPNDPNRDYATPGGVHIYPETAAIERLILARRPVVVLDLHSPWLRGDPTNEWPYLVGAREDRTKEPTERFNALLEAECPPEAPFRAADFVPFGAFWNTGANYQLGRGLKSWAATLPFVALSQTIEIPFANFREKTQTPATLRAFGRGVANALMRFLLEQNP